MKLPDIKLLNEIKNDPKKVLIVVVLATAVILLAYLNFILRPQVQGLFGNIVGVSKLNADFTRAKADIAKIGQLRASISKYDEKIEHYGDLLPTEQGIPALLENLSDIARSSGMKIISIVPLEDKGAAIQRGQAYQAIPIQITAKAGYHELGRFVSTLENSGRFMKIADMRIRANAANPKKHDVELLILTYILLEGK